MLRNNYANLSHPFQMAQVNLRNLQGKSWCFTINNPEFDITEESMEDFPNLLFMVCQHEIGDGTDDVPLGTKHIQGTCEFKSNVRGNTFKNMFDDQGVHVELRIGTRRQVVTYCSKDDTRDPDFDTVFFPSKLEVEVYCSAHENNERGKRNDLHKATDLIREGASMKRVADECAVTFVKYDRGLKRWKTTMGLDKTDRVNCIVEYWVGPPGTGKTWLAKQRYPPSENVYWKSPGKWWDGYTNQKIIVLNDFDDSWMTLGELKRMLDDGAVQTETKGATVWLQATTFIFTSNRKPKNLYKKKLKGLKWESGSNPLWRRFPVIKLMDVEFVPIGDAIPRVQEDAEWDDGYDDDSEDGPVGFIGQDGQWRAN